MRFSEVQTNTFIARDSLSAPIAAAARKIESIMVVPDTGLKVVFETQDVQWGDEKFVEPFCVASHDFERDGPEPGTPNRVLDHLHTGSWYNFIWLPSWLCHSDPYKFSMRYIHEMQHYRQILDSASTESAQRFLMSLRGRSQALRIKIERDPRELDADRTAREIFARIYGKMAMEGYIHNESKCPRMAAFHSRLSELIEQWKVYERETA